MTIEIVHRYTKAVLYKSEADTLKNAAVEAVGKNTDLGGAYLGGAYLRGAKINWTDHYLVSELLLRAAKTNIEKRKLAGLVRISTEWCWDKFLSIDEPLRDWALAELRKAVRDGDNAPEVLKAKEEKIGNREI